MKRSVEKYLKNYSESECSLLSRFPQVVFEHCAVIPCYDEEIDFISEAENSFSNAKNTLFIIVVNQPIGSGVVLRNAKITDHFANNYSSQWKEQRLSLYTKDTSALSWLIVNRCDDGGEISAKQGVGLARKIGCDIAVALFAQRNLSSTWIHCTDADTTLPANYFELPVSTKNEPSYSAAVFSFCHLKPKHSGLIDDRNQETVFKATLLYEQALNYYVAGLAWAGSPYAHHTIGSALACSIEPYCQVRGFPKRPAGEDFYLLNKLCKIAPIYKAKDINLVIDSRLSERVPFGTGPAVEKILALDNPEHDYTYYSPLTFVALKKWLDVIPHIWDSLQNNAHPIEHLSEEIKDALNQAHIEKLFDHIKEQTKNQQACTKAIHDWFDGFQTLKFIRRLQSSRFPDKPLSTCLAEAPFTIQP